MVERAAAQVYSASPSISPSSFDSAIAEIAARQNELDAAAAPDAAAAGPADGAVRATADDAQGSINGGTDALMAAPMAPPPGPDFSMLERHLFKITSQIEALQRPDHLEQSIAAFRSELAEIRHAITEAMPRRAIESIENEIRSLSRRIDDTRESGTDSQALAGIERALGEIYDALRALTPAEQLAGYDDAIRNLHTKLDLILRSNDDPSTMHQLEGAIAALRSIVSNVASTDALARLSDDVHMLSSKVDQLAHSPGHGDALAMLEQRIAALTSSIESREAARPAESSGHSEFLESAIRALTERIDRMPVGNDNASAFAHLEQRVSYLLERIEASTDPRANNLGRVEDALLDIQRHLEAQHANLNVIADNSRQPAYTPPPIDTAMVDIVKRELSDIRFSQVETDRRTQDALETVHSSLGHIVDRLAMIEGDLRERPAPAAAPAPMPMAPMPMAMQMPEPPAPPAPVYVEPVYVEPVVEAPRMAMPQPKPEFKPELPNPAAQQAHFVAAPRDFHAAAPEIVVEPPADAGNAARDQRNPRAARQFARRDRVRFAAGSSARAGHAAGSADVLAVGADRSLRGSARRDQGDAKRADEHVELHRRSPPRRPGGCRRADE